MPCVTLTPWHRSERFEGDWVSRARLERVRLLLLALPDQLVALVDVLARGGRRADLGMPGRPRGARGGSSPLREGVLDLLDDREKEAELDPIAAAADARESGRRRGLVPTLAGWVRFAHAEMVDAGVECRDPAEPPSVVSACGWLLGHWEWIERQQWVVELVDELESIGRDVRGFLGAADEFVPTCSTCGRALAVTVGMARCGTCGETRADGRLSLLERAHEPLPTREAAAAAGVSRETVQRWVRAEWLWPAYDEAGAPIKCPNGGMTFHLDEVLQVAASKGLRR